MTEEGKKSHERPQARVKTAVVLSRKMDKTAVVSIERLVKHPLYQKLIRKRSKFKIHDPKNETKKGDVVLDGRNPSDQRRQTLETGQNPEEGR